MNTLIDKIVALVPKKQENIKEVKVPDLKEYLLKGYEEIRQVKKEKDELEEKLEEANKNKILYEGALVTLEEFRKRDTENIQKIEQLKDKIQSKDDEIYQLKDKLNTYRIKEKEMLDKEKQLDNEIKKIENTIELEVEEKIKKKVSDLKENISYKIKNTKGNLSKEKILELINS